jgi:hypothetical protein
VIGELCLELSTTFAFDRLGFDLDRRGDAEYLIDQSRVLCGSWFLGGGE